MKASVIHNFIDNRIRQFYEKEKNMNDVIEMLQNHVNHPDRNKNKFKAYISIFSNKRVQDIQFLLKKDPDIGKKIFGLLKLRDKLNGIPDFEVSDFQSANL